MWLVIYDYSCTLPLPGSQSPGRRFRNAAALLLPGLQDLHSFGLEVNARGAGASGVDYTESTLLAVVALAVAAANGRDEFVTLRSERSLD